MGKAEAGRIEDGETRRDKAEGGSHHYLAGRGCRRKAGGRREHEPGPAKRWVWGDVRCGRQHRPVDGSCSQELGA